MSDKQKDLIREVFLRNGFTIKAGADDLADYVYEAARDLLQVAPAVQGEPVAWINGETLLGITGDRGRRFQRCWLNHHRTDEDDTPLYTAPKPAEQQECGCCGQTVRCDDDCDAVVIGGHRPAEQRPASSDKVRAEFEAWANSFFANAPTKYKRDALPKDDPSYGDYVAKSLQAAWLAWQASLAAYRNQGGDT